MRAIHPGEILREEVIAARDLAVTDAAKMLGISYEVFENIVSEKSDITPEISLKIADAFGGTSDIWDRLQAKYNLRLKSQQT